MFVFSDGGFYTVCHVHGVGMNFCRLCQPLSLLASKSILLEKFVNIVSRKLAELTSIKTIICTYHVSSVC